MRRASPTSLLFVLMAAGCTASISPAAKRITVASKYETQNCRLLTVVYGYKEQNMLLTKQQRALEEAARIGATHIVWVGLKDSGTADAFDCTKPSRALERAKKADEERKQEVQREAARKRLVVTNVPADAKDRDWVIAVMNVENNTGKQRFDDGMISSVGNQLRVFVAEKGIRTVDRGLQERTLKEQIANMKSESYEQCFDNSCQIELGKALAASHILRSHINAFGTMCVLNAEVIDLREEVTIAAATSRGVCTPEGFLTMTKNVADSLVSAVLSPRSSDPVPSLAQDAR